jgi:hypothetical protein
MRLAPLAKRRLMSVATMLIAFSHSIASTMAE